MFKAIKKVLVCALAATVALGSAGVSQAATKSPTTSVQPTKQEDVKAEKTNGIVPTVDTSKNGTATLTEIKKTDKKAVTVPASVTVDGVEYKVTKITAGTFKNVAKATKVTIPATITTIGKGAFTGAKNVKTVVLNTKKAITVKKGAFKGVDTTKMTIKVSKKMSAKELKKLKKTLKAAGFKGTVVKG